jgi:hypothetical protein
MMRFVVVINYNSWGRGNVERSIDLKNKGEIAKTAL